MNTKDMKWYVFSVASGDEDRGRLSKGMSEESARDAVKVAAANGIPARVIVGVEPAVDSSPRFIFDKPTAKPAAVVPASALVPCIAVIKPGATPDEDVLCTGQGPKGGRLAGICSEHAKQPTTTKDEWRARRKGRTVKA